MGAPARGLVEEDFAKVTEFFDRAVAVAVDLKKKTKEGKKLKSFKKICSVGPSISPALVDLRWRLLPRSPTCLLSYTKLMYCWQVGE